MARPLQSVVKRCSAIFLTRHRDGKYSSGFMFARFVLGALLLTAAALKGNQLLADTAATAVGGITRWVTFGLVVAESLLSVWLLSGWWARPAWVAALVTFGSFAGYSFVAILQGQASCDCFGAVKADPRIAIVIDLGAVGMLLAWRPSKWKFSAHHFNSELPSDIVASHPVPSFVCVIASILMGAVAGWALSNNAVGTSRLYSHDNLRILEPEQWIGKPFPLFDYIDIGDMLKKGNWFVVLYHHDCQKCEEAIRSYAELVRGSPNDRNLSRLALIEMPPYGERPAVLQTLSAQQFIYGQLNDKMKWFVATPAEIRLVDSVVYE